MSEETKKALEAIKQDLTNVTNQITGNKTALELELQTVKGSIEGIKQGVDRIEEATKKDPPDPVARKAAQQLPALTKSLGDVAGGLKRVILLRGEHASDQELAAESLRITGSLLETAAAAALIAPPPYGKIAAEIISAIQGLVNFVATILDLTNPKKKEPSIADIVANAVRSAEGYAHYNLLNGVVAQLRHMEAGLNKLHEQKDDPKYQRTFETWNAIWDTVQLPANEGVTVRVDSMPFWLMDEQNLSLDPDPWGQVFYLYLLAKGQYLRNWLSAMLLLNTWDVKDPGPEKSLINRDFLVAQALLDSVVKTEQTTLGALVPFAVRKTVGVAIDAGESIQSSQKGFALEKTEWPNQRLSGGAVKKVVAGPEGRVWSIHNVGELYCYKLDGQGKQLHFFKYPPPKDTSPLPSPLIPDGVPNWGDICVVWRGGQASEIHALYREPDRQPKPTWQCFFWDEGKVGTRQPWDHTFFEKMQQQSTKARQEAIQLALDPGCSTLARQIAASPEGCLYFLLPSGYLSGGGLHYWDPTKPKNMRNLHYPPIQWDVEDLKLSSGSERVYIFGNQDIWYKSHADIARVANSDWTKITPPSKAPENKSMPTGWFYKSVTESEGGAILASIELPGFGSRFYMWHDGNWKVGSDKLWGQMLITLPLDSHDTFNALKNKVDELIAGQQPSTS